MSKKAHFVTAPYFFIESAIQALARRFLEPARGIGKASRSTHASGYLS